MEGHRKQGACTLVLPVSLVSLQRAQIFECSSNVATCGDFWEMGQWTLEE